MDRIDLLQIAKPILFNTDMVRAILDGRKTVTRRVVKLPKYIKEQENGFYTLFADGTYYENQEMKNIVGYIKKTYQPGDILYVREIWQYLFELGGNEQTIEGTGKYYYAATDTIPLDTYVDSMGVTLECVPWRPSIHMPKEAARIFLKVKNVRMERLQDITGGDLLKEGIDLFQSNFVRVAFDEFSALWDSTIKKSDVTTYSWEANPWVWVIEFERIEVE